jgi:hypothetical protein
MLADQFLLQFFLKLLAPMVVLQISFAMDGYKEAKTMNT